MDSFNVFEVAGVVREGPHSSTADTEVVVFISLEVLFQVSSILSEVCLAIEAQEPEEASW